jgi:bacillithiol system protein YtxJ
MEFRFPFASVPDDSALDRVFSTPGLTLIYLHDPWCPINAHAMRQLNDVPGPIHSIDVSTQHELKRAVADHTGVIHQSPQAILLRDGKPVWHASHYDISGADVLEAIAAAAPAPAPDPS